MSGDRLFLVKPGFEDPRAAGPLLRLPALQRDRGIAGVVSRIGNADRGTPPAVRASANVPRRIPGRAASIASGSGLR